MGTVDQEFQSCLSENRVTVFADGPKLVDRQLEIASDDLAEAAASAARGAWKWSTIQSYYSMYHTARALLFARSFREKNHRCLRIAIASLYAREGEEFASLVDDFNLGKQLRENAGYADDFSENGAQKLMASARRFLEAARTVLGRHA
ncbi:MAG: HEPN domain-containing protein [Deltaproteobacteria bacterium]|nr:HEPN domain-containing protein [Deltaproteobacteria bacterium]